MPSYNKKGPGRPPRSRRTTGPRRLNVRTSGGNWQGTSYLSYAQHDAVVRAYIESRGH